MFSPLCIMETLQVGYVTDSDGCAGETQHDTVQPFILKRLPIKVSLNRAKKECLYVRGVCSPDG